MHRQRPHHDGNHRSGAGNGARRVAWFMTLALVVMGVMVMSMTPRVHPPIREELASLSARRLQATATEAAVAAAVRRSPVYPEDRPHVSGDGTSEPEIVLRNPLTTPGNEPVVRIDHIRSPVPSASKDEGLRAALEIAREVVATQLQTIDPSLTAPSAVVIRDRYLRPESIREIKPTPEDKTAWEKAKVGANRVWIEIDIQITANQLRELRSEDRLARFALYGAFCYVAVALLHLGARFRRKVASVRSAPRTVAA